MSRLASYKGLGGIAASVEMLSTASTVCTLTDDQQGKLVVWNGQSSAARIRLPDPEAGMTYRIFFNDDAVSSATKITCSQAEIYYAHIDRVQTTAAAVSLGSTLEGGAWIEVTALNDYRWAVTDAKGSSVNNVNLGTTTT